MVPKIFEQFGELFSVSDAHQFDVLSLGGFPNFDLPLYMVVIHCSSFLDIPITNSMWRIAYSCQKS